VLAELLTVELADRNVAISKQRIERLREGLVHDGDFFEAQGSELWNRPLGFGLLHLQLGVSPLPHVGCAEPPDVAEEEPGLGRGGRKGVDQCDPMSDQCP